MEGILDQQKRKQVLAQMGEAILNSDSTQRLRHDGINKGAFPMPRELAYRYAADALDALHSAGFKVIENNSPAAD
jgi:hypothetical protein